MKPQYLFVFPVSEYFRRESESTADLRRGVEKINRSLRRYREDGVDVNWLLFSLSGERDKPNTRNLQRGIYLDPRDRLIPLGYTYKEFQDMYKVPWRRVLQQLPQHRKLTLGGFHSWDCVRRVARSARLMGKEVKIDYETTELLF